MPTDANAIRRDHVEGEQGLSALPQHPCLPGWRIGSGYTDAGETRRSETAGMDRSSSMPARSAVTRARP